MYLFTLLFSMRNMEYKASLHAPYKRQRAEFNSFLDSGHGRVRGCGMGDMRAFERWFGGCGIKWGRMREEGVLD